MMKSSDENIINWAKEQLSKIPYLRVESNSKYNGIRVDILAKDTRNGNMMFMYANTEPSLAHLLSLYDVRNYNDNAAKSKNSNTYVIFSTGRVGKDVGAVAGDYGIPIIDTKDGMKKFLKNICQLQ